MTFSLKLTHDEPRLVYLALVYHLGRPGSELDATTWQPAEHGLREVKVALGRDIERDETVVELDETQYRKLLSAIYGCVNELRVYHMRNGAESTVSRFTATAESLFPEIKVESDEALAVSEAMMMLHRRIERAVANTVPSANEPDSASVTRSRWRIPFRR